MKVGIVGLGLIGGSVALDLKANHFASEIIGADLNAEHVKEAMGLKLVDSVKTLKEVCSEVDLLILATPVNSITKLLPQVLDLISDRTTVTDVGSTKKQMVDAVRQHPRRKQYVPSHPMAGTEFSGPKAAIFGLFREKAAVICDANESNPESVTVIESFYHALGMRLIHMNSSEHDLHAAYVSHLSHISSFVLANTVLDKEKDVDAIFNLASGGFESTVRLAKSSPEMWAPIFEQNQIFVTEALGAYIERLQLFQKSLIQKNYPETKKYMQHANEITRVLAKIGNQNGDKREQKK
jgi:prephenate dehydrogenase